MSQAPISGIRTSNNPGEQSTSQTSNADAIAAVNVTQPVTLNDVYEPIRNELNQVQEILKSELRSDTPFVDSLLEHSWLMGGKRIRPVFLLLSAASCGEIQQSHLQICLLYTSPSPRDRG